MRMNGRWGRVLAMCLTVMVSLMHLTGGSAAAQTGTGLPGIVGEGEYESPKFGTHISWTDAWKLGDVTDPHVAHAVGGYVTEPVVSDPEFGDMLYLADAATGSAVVSISLAVTDLSQDELIASMQTDAFLEDTLFMQPGADILSLETRGTTVGMLVRDTGRGSDHALYVAVQVPRNASDPTFVVAIDLFDPETYGASLHAADEDLVIDGFSFFRAHTVGDVISMLDDGSGARTVTPTPAAGTPRSTALSGDEYLQAVREDTDLRKKQLDRLSSILFDSGTISAADGRELEAILQEWMDLQPIQAPEGFVVIDDEHRALVKNLNALASALVAVSTGSLDAHEQQQQLNLAGGAYQTSVALVGELDDSLSAEGV